MTEVKLTMAETKEFAAFKAMFLTVGVFARLAEQCGRYISRLSNEDREFVIAVALEVAWTGREEFDPEKHSLLYWWDDCLRNTMKTREEWVCRHNARFIRTSTKQILAWEDEE